MTHLEQLKKHFDFTGKKVLDVGCGRGGFLEECKDEGIEAEGIDTCREYVADCQMSGLRAILGQAEHLPYKDKSFDFINLSGTIEHVNLPGKTLLECFRVLADHGAIYVDVPNRLGFIDPHYKKPFYNWIPRKWLPKRIEASDKGHQQVKDMHYFTYWDITMLFEENGFIYKNTRYDKVPKILRVIYRFIEPFLISTFHFILNKNPFEINKIYVNPDGWFFTK